MLTIGLIFVILLVVGGYGLLVVAGYAFNEFIKSEIEYNRKLKEREKEVSE